MRAESTASLLDEEKGVPHSELSTCSLPKFDSIDFQHGSRRRLDTSPFANTGDELSPNARVKRRRYLGLTSDVLKAMCDERGIAFSEDLGREQLVTMLEEDDKMKALWVQSRAFEYFFLFVVVLNSIAIGVEIDYQDTVPHAWFLAMNYIFFLLFLTEIVIKFSVLGPREYFRDLWNVFDILVIIASTADIIAARLTPSGETQIVRMCRICRLARIFKELGVLVQSFLLSMRALSWVLGGMLIWFYLAACFTTLFIGRRRFELIGEEVEQMQELRAKFDTIPLSMFALFEIMTLEGWSDYVRPFLHSRTAHLVAFFILFIFVSAFFLLNLVTAVVVDRTVTAQEEVKESKEREQKLLRRVHVGIICENLQIVSEDRKTISREAFERVITHVEEVRETMRWLRWGRTYMLSIFDTMDVETSGHASLSQLEQLFVVCDEPLDTANYARFQASLSNRLEHQEQMLMAALSAIQAACPQNLNLPDEMLQRMQRQTTTVMRSPHDSNQPSD